MLELSTRMGENPALVSLLMDKQSQAEKAGASMSIKDQLQLEYPADERC